MSSNLIETKVDSDGLTQLIQRLGRDCTPTQFVREFVQNGIEAIQRTKKSGMVCIDSNWAYFEKTHIHKICFIDNGDGMTPDEMLKHLNNLSSSGHDKNVYENYGVGAKIAALTRNHHGIIYDSWKNGEGYRIFIHFDKSEKKYGIQYFDDGRSSWHLKLADSEKPDFINQHGTRVTLLGMEEMDDTMLPPSNAKGGRETWLAYNINTRYFRVPNGIKISARVGYYRGLDDKKHCYPREINGQENTLSKFSEFSGIVKLSDALVHWWILQPERNGHSRELVAGHTACINQNELFDLAEGRSSRAPNFGVWIGKENVVLYIEPAEKKYVQNTARTGLVENDGSPLPWSRWEDEFREKIPKEIDSYIKRKTSEISVNSHEDKIRERLKSIANFFKISRYRLMTMGSINADPASEVISDTGHGTSETQGEGGIRKSAGNSTGGFKEALMSGVIDSGVPSEEVTPDKFPRFNWVTVEDGSRSPEDMDDRAAKYIVKENRIIGNADFQGFKDVIEYFSTEFVGIEGSELMIKEIVREIFEQQLTETVTGALCLKNRPKWKPEEFEKALSEEALTSAVMSRYFIVNHIKKQLGNHFKSLKPLPQQSETNT